MLSKNVFFNQLNIFFFFFGGGVGKFYFTEKNLEIRPAQMKPLCIYLKKISFFFINQWPNLKNLSGGLNLSRGLNMVCFT